MSAQSQRGRREEGFTLIELIVVITIMGILATAVVYNVVGKADDARLARVKQDFASIKNAANFYRLDFGRWPESFDQLLNPEPTDSGRQNKYLDSPPRDPWGNDYLYEVTGDGILLTSYGADGSPGGGELDADITSADEEQP